MLPFSFSRSTCMIIFFPGIPTFIIKYSVKEPQACRRALHTRRQGRIRYSNAHAQHLPQPIKELTKKHTRIPTTNTWIFLRDALTIGQHVPRPLSEQSAVVCGINLQPSPQKQPKMCGLKKPQSENERVWEEFARSTVVLATGAATREAVATDGAPVGA